MIRSVMMVAGCSLVFLVGCRDNGVKDNKSPVKIEQPPPAGIQEVWMQVDGMSERLKII